MMQTRNRFLTGLGLLLCLALPAQAENGITATEIHFGQTAALDGPAAALGLGMRQGIQAAFAEANAAGGVHGRTLHLTSMDDGYEPERALYNAKTLISIDKVFALIGTVGTPTTSVIETASTPAKVPLIGAFTGANAFRTPYNRYIVNVRASYTQEMEEWVAYLTGVHGASRIGILYQDDAFGQAGLNALKLALDKRKLAPASQGTFERNTIAVRQAALDIQEGNPDAIVTIAPYHPTAEFIRMMNALGVKAPIISISFVGSEALAKDIGLAGTGVYVTQVVPLPTNTSLPLVREYQAALHALDPAATPGFISLEGYLVGRLTIAALRKGPADITRESFLDAVYSFNSLNLGGIELNYGPDDNQGMNTIYMTRLNAQGTYDSVDTKRTAN